MTGSGGGFLVHYNTDRVWESTRHDGMWERKGMI